MLTPEQKDYLTVAIRQDLRRLWLRASRLAVSWGGEGGMGYYGEEDSLEEVEDFIREMLPAVWDEAELRAGYREFYPR